MCCSVSQCVAVCCSVLQRVAACCRLLQCAVVCCSVLQCAAVRCSMSVQSLSPTYITASPLMLTCSMHDEDSYIILDSYTQCCSTLQCVAVYCIVLQSVAQSTAKCVQKKKVPSGTNWHAPSRLSLHYVLLYVWVHTCMWVCAWECHRGGAQYVTHANIRGRVYKMSHVTPINESCHIFE